MIVDIRIWSKKRKKMLVTSKILQNITVLISKKIKKEVRGDEKEMATNQRPMR